MRSRPALLTLPLALALAAGCAPFEDDDALPMPTRDERDPDGKADAPGGGADHQWIYNGMLPALDEPSLVISLAGHTVRVTGLLPADWDAPLPYYAITEPAGDRTQVHVVYPIATANLAGGSTNAAARDYPDLAGPVYTPNGIGGNDVPWGGFPYLEYHHARAIALHGPITWTGSQWRLRRGRVSHGCNRMQGEHVVELAHLLGKDMTRPHEVSDGLRVYASGDYMVRVIDGFDEVDGEIVDVDYPAGPGFERPTGADVRVWPTWSNDDFPRFVCQYRADRPAGPAHCDYREPTAANPLRLEDLGAIECPAGYWIEAVGSEGGRVCTDGTSLLGPYTQRMIEACHAGGGGSACDTDRWAYGFGMSLRGERACPAGATVDYRATAYCVEGSDAFGPFPRTLVARCGELGGGQACSSARWSHTFLVYVLSTL